MRQGSASLGAAVGHSPKDAATALLRIGLIVRVTVNAAATVQIAGMTGVTIVPDVVVNL